MGKCNDTNKKMMEWLELSETKNKSLLLHACCAPCASSCLERLNERVRLTVLFYNPNMATEEEYLKRAEETKRIIKAVAPGANLIIKDYNPVPFLEMAKGLEQEPERGVRCERCYRLRLEETLRMAVEGGYDYFATTLTLSPLKPAEVINSIGAALEDCGCSYLPTDFKKQDGYKRSIELSEEYGLYRQNFCGCSFSKRN